MGPLAEDERRSRREPGIAVSSSRSRPAATELSRSIHASAAVRSSGSAAGHWLGPSSHRLQVAGTGPARGPLGPYVELVPPVADLPAHCARRRCACTRGSAASWSRASRSAWGGAAKNRCMASSRAAVSPSVTPCPTSWKNFHVVGRAVQLRVQQGTGLGAALGRGEIDDRKLLVRPVLSALPALQVLAESVCIIMRCVRRVYGCPGGRRGWGGAAGAKGKKRDEVRKKPDSPCS